MGSKLRTVSWVLLAVVGVLVLLVSLVSANLAYRGDFPVGGVSIGEIAVGTRRGAARACAASRGTAAAWAAAWAVLFLAVVLGPYRRGDVATWWGILASVLVLGAVVGARVLFLTVAGGHGRGRSSSSVVVLVALLLDVKRLTGAALSASAAAAARGSRRGGRPRDGRARRRAAEPPPSVRPGTLVRWPGAGHRVVRARGPALRAARRRLLLSRRPAAPGGPARARARPRRTARDGRGPGGRRSTTRSRSSRCRATWSSSRRRTSRG